MAALLIDMPGVGDAPLPGSEDAERMWDAVFDWIATRKDLDASRVGIWGGSTGGYWGAKLAHTHKDRMAAAVCHGGCAHYAFEPKWIEKAQHGTYAFELAETLASAFGRNTFEEWVEYCPRLSLLEQSVIDKPCAPLLLVNGVQGLDFPDRGHVSAARARQRQDGAVLRVGPHGQLADHHPDHRRVAEAAAGSLIRLYCQDFRPSDRMTGNKAVKGTKGGNHVHSEPGARGFRARRGGRCAGVRACIGQGV